MKITNLKILILEDNHSDVLLMERELKKGFSNFTIKWVETEESYIHELSNCEYDIILCDYSLPSYDGLSALKYAIKKCPTTPFIIVTGSLDEETAVELILAGAWDYVLKEKLIRLTSSIKSSLKLKKEMEEKAIAEQSLRKSEVKFRRIFESYQDVYYESDLEGKLLEISPSCYDIFGYSRKELLGTSIEKLYKNENDSSIFFHKLKEERMLNDYELQMIHKNGKIFPCSVSAKLTTIDNNSISVIGSLRNISARKSAEYELIMTKEKVEESDRLKSVFLSIMSHELRTPLNAIIGFSDVITKNSNIDDIVYFNSLINKNGKSLLSIIDEIFHVSSIYGKNVKLSNDKFFLSDIFNKIYETNVEELLNVGKQNIKLTVSHCKITKDQYVITDKVKLKRVLMILVNNAIKFTESGSVEFGYEMQADKQFLFFIKDTGCGIPPEKHDMIYDGFRLGDESHSRKHGGIGLGLHIVKKVVELLGGEIFFKTKVNKSTEFYFYLKLPIIKQQKAKIEKKSDENIKWENTNLLVVDDHYSSVELVKIILKKTGINIGVAIDGEEGVKFCNENQNTDIVLMDIKMPHLDGYNATKAIKRLHENIIIIATTAYALVGDRERAIEAGCDDYVPKPINSVELIETIGKYIDSK